MATNETKTMTAEEVERDAETVRSAMVLGAIQPTSMYEQARLRLASQAARVEGLEASLKASLENTAEEQEANRRLADRLASAADDAARARSERDASEGHGREWRARAATALAEHEQDAATLRERVATLERELSELNGEAQRINEMHTTAEARVKELEAQVEEARSATLDNVELVPSVESPDTWTLVFKSQPPPAPAQGVKCSHCKGSGTDVDTDEEGGTQNETHFACSTCKGTGKTPTPTPPPGLCEAAGPLMPALRAMAADGRPDSAATNLHNDYRYDATFGQVRAFVAAYDATGGETPDLKRLEDALYHEDAKGNGEPL